MGNNVSISFGNSCNVFQKLKKMCPEGKSFSKFIVFVCQDWLAKKDMSSYFVDDSTPNDMSPLDTWAEWISTTNNDELVRILKIRRRINTLLEKKIFD